MAKNDTTDTTDTAAAPAKRPTLVDAIAHAAEHEVRAGNAHWQPVLDAVQAERAERAEPAADPRPSAPVEPIRKRP